MINSGFLGFGDVIQFAPANMFFWDGYWVNFIVSTIGIF